MNSLFSSNNHLFALARTGRRLPHVILAVALSFGFILVAQFGGGIPAVLLILALSLTEGASLSNAETMTGAMMPNTALKQFIFLTLLFFPIFLLLWGWLAVYEKRPLWTLGLEREGAIKKYLRGWLLGLLMFGSAVGLSAVMGFMTIEPENPAQSQGVMAWSGVLLVFLGWMVQGAAEEALARGWLLPVIGARYQPLWGIVVSSLTFAVYHSLNPNLTPIAVLNLFLFGVFASLYALSEGGLWGVFSLHAAWNWAQGNLFGLHVSGITPAGGTLFNLVEVGPDVITGGSFGPEGGLAVTVVLLVSCGLIRWMSGVQIVRRENKNGA